MYGKVVRDAGYTIRSMAERCGMSAHTLRYYERVGLIQPVSRARNGLWPEEVTCGRRF